MPSIKLEEQLEEQVDKYVAILFIVNCDTLAEGRESNNGKLSRTIGKCQHKWSQFDKICRGNGQRFVLIHRTATKVFGDNRLIPVEFQFN
jgi:hypothetical protein